ncbi:MAG: oligopeptide transporter, OPT family [Candidatus Hydrogenedentes bacterium]|nr:oligopeptide transporter, OPT family [Candidatus Hydrogenedentota bacterium]
MSNVRESGAAPEARGMAESTFLSLGLGLLLAIILGAANVYLGLFAGMTVSASIPAAVVSMAILRGLFRRGTILENNISQTVASTGESLAAGAIFTLPALILTGVWTQFDYWLSTGIVLAGGLLGIVFMVPLRKALIVDRKDLRYPEGVACAEVLAAGQEMGGGLRAMAIGAGLGALFKALSSGLGLILETVEGAVALGGRVFYAGAAMSPALVAVGYIVGLGVASQIFLGGVIGWAITIPATGPWFGPVEDPPLDHAKMLWSTQVRYMGVGAMLAGGLYSLWSVRAGLVAGVKSLRAGGVESGAARTERNMGLGSLAALLLFSVLLTFVIYYFLIDSLALSVAALLIMIPAAFLFAAVATYIVGLVGSSNSPVSGMTICALLVAAFVIWLDGGTGRSAILATLGVAGVVCCVACTAGDVAQDLKTGQLVGATPARQQWAEVLGVIIPAFVMAPVLSLLHARYVIGEGLLAPQATLFASLAQGFFGDGDLPYPMIAAGVLIGVAIIAADCALDRRGARFRLHVMPVAVGIYLPLYLATAIVAGGLLHWWLHRNRAGEDPVHNAGILFGSGLIAGEALMGIGLAVPVVFGIHIAGGVALPAPLQVVLSLALFAAVVAVYGRVARPGSTAG